MSVVTVAATTSTSSTSTSTAAIIIVLDASTFDTIPMSVLTEPVVHWFATIVHGSSFPIAKGCIKLSVS